MYECNLGVVVMRPMWSGSLAFGLVNIPIRLYSATGEKGIDFDFLHKKDLSPIRYAKVCKADQEEIPNEDIVRGFEYRKGDYIVVTDEDFERANVRRTKTIEIVDFVAQEEIDTVYYEKPYYLEPDRGADKPYALLREALRKSGKVGVAKFVFKNREHIAVIKPKDDMIVLNQLRFKSEIREAEGLNLPSAEQVTDREMEMALALVSQLTETFKPEDYKDSYTEELKRVIEEKAQGKTPEVRGEAPEPTPVIDLMAVLKASLEQERKKAS